MTRKIFSSLLITVFCTVFCTVFSLPICAAPSQNLSERFQAAVKKSGLGPAEIGLWVGTKTESGISTLVATNADTLFNPGAVSELLTAGAVLQTLRPGFKFRTVLLSEAKVQDGVLQGPLYIKGGGDPLFNSQSFWLLVNEFTRNQIKQINGPIIVDGSRFKLEANEKTLALSLDSATLSHFVPVGKNLSEAPGYALLEFLKQRGITVKGDIKIGVAPKAAQPLAGVDSQTLPLLIGKMVKDFDNQVADILARDLAAEAAAEGVSETQGVAVVNKFLQMHGLKDGAYQFKSVTGADGLNQLSAAQIGRFLESERHDFSSYPEYLTILPLAGVEGGLKARMKNTPAERWVRAQAEAGEKATALAGYAAKKNGQVLSFAFLAKTSGEKVRELFDQLASILAAD